MSVKALSIRSPWWWFILHGGKDIENRDWPTKYRGVVYLHASRWWKQDEIAEDLDFCERTSGARPKRSQLSDGMGCMVGAVEIVDCVRASTSPWFFGRFGFVLRNPAAFIRPVPCLGALGLFEVAADVVAECRGQESRRGLGNLSLFGGEA